TAGGGTFAVGGFEGDDALLDRRAFEPHGAADANTAVAAARRENNRGARQPQQHAPAGPIQCRCRKHDRLVVAKTVTWPRRVRTPRWAPADRMLSRSLGLEIVPQCFALLGR